MTNSKKYQFSLFIFILLIFTCFDGISQNVEVQGNLKVSQMQSDNDQDNIVVRAADGTLKTRSVNSLPADLTDTVRTLMTDIELAKFLCSCSSVPPFLINSALASGYTLDDLIGGGVSIPDLINGGVSINDLLNEGYSVADLMAEGISIQELLDEGVPPLDILNAGASTSDFIGLLYEGGMIFYITGSGTGLISSLADQSPGAQWGPIYSAVGVYDTVIGTGQLNTTGIVAAYGSGVSYAARLCDTLMLNGYSDWYLPSRDELALMWTNLADSDGNGSNTGPADPNNLAGFETDKYWSSSEVNNTFAWVHNFSDGAVYNSVYGKITSIPNVRAIRSF